MSQPENSAPEREIEMDEVKQHNKDNDCWVVINGAVYNATPFLDSHPGGPSIITDLAGQDATDEFEDTGHSEDARRQLAPLKVGTLKGAKVVTNKAAPKAQAAAAGGNPLYILLAVAVAAFAVYLNFMG